MRKIVTYLLIALLSFSIIACSSMNKTTKGAAVGTAGGGAVGAVIGNQFGNSVLGAIIGAAVGGAAGAYIGNKMDKQAAEIEQQLADAKVERVGEGIQVTLKSGLLFDSGKSVLKPAAQTDLAELATTLNKYSDTVLLIEGHADSQGDEAYNQKLSEARAHAVASFLAKNNVDISRFTIIGYGESQPVASNDTPEGRAQNRRVEIAITAGEAMKAEARAATSK
ncbi:MAG TPA: OmpA family protein [bacterium]|nr:OmpA family protein [bacterium]HQG45277.1 OmpA family protein [bacterium]HQI47188.1 OmpA family protein [bacterium]HQJ63513.1 OmpA family protein [bacterium]